MTLHFPLLRDNPYTIFNRIYPKQIRLYTLFFLIHISRKTIFNAERQLGDTTVDGSAMLLLISTALMGYIILSNQSLISKSIKGTKNLFLYFIVCLFSCLWLVTPAYVSFFTKFMEVFSSYLAIAIVIYKIKDREKAFLYVLYLLTSATLLGIAPAFKTGWFHTNAYTCTAMAGTILSLGMLKYLHYRPASWFLYINLFSLIMGTSSGSYISFIVAMVFFLSTTNRGVPLVKVLLVSILLYCIYLAFENTIYELVFYGHDERSIEGGTGRYEVWQIYIDAWKKSPFLGYGFSIGERNLEILGGRFNILSAHNGFISCIVGTGLLGAFFYILFWAKTIINIYSKTFSTRYAGIAATLLAAIVGVFVNNMTYPAIGGEWYYTSTATFALFILANTIQHKQSENSSLRRYYR